MKILIALITYIPDVFSLGMRIWKAYKAAQDTNLTRPELVQKIKESNGDFNKIRESLGILPANK